MMESNNLFHDRYFLERLLGRGNFSEVWLAKDTKTDIHVALKIYAPATGLDDAGLNVFAREFSLVVNANHKNLLKPLYYDSCERKPYLVLPFCKRGSIQKEIGKFKEDDAWRLLRDVSSGLAWLHGMDPVVIHQDIKPDNVMVGDNGDFMITDFGVSTHLKSTLRKSLSSAFSSAGTIAYMAPERFSKENTPIMANDVYSLGATVFEMLSGDTPFGDDGGLMQKKGAEIPVLKGDYSEQLKKVIFKCLQTNPWERPTAEQLEQYAEAGLKGETIRFADEKTFWEKHKKSIIGLSIIVVVGLVIGGVWVKQDIDKKEQLKHELSMKLYNDSLFVEIKKSVQLGDKFLSEGDMRDEGYETSYLKAFENYQKAIEDGRLLQNGVANPDENNIQNKISELHKKLQESYNSLLEKAELFMDDVEISDEFKQRAAKINQVIGTNN